MITTTIPPSIPTHGPLMLRQLIGHYLATEFIDKAPGTLIRAEYGLWPFERFIAGRQFIINRKVDLALYSQWIAHEFGRVQGSTALKLVTIIVAFLNWLVVHGVLESDTHRLVKHPRVAKKPPRPCFTIDEYERLKVAAAKMGDRHYWLCVVGWNTGQARVDCSLLKHADVDLDTMFVTIVRQKMRMGNRTARIAIASGSDFHLGLIERTKIKDPCYPNDPAKGVYFVHPDLALQAIRALNQRPGQDTTKWNYICERAGVDKRKTFHSMRATMCSTLMSNGVNPLVACQITGHSSLASLAVYATIDDATLSEAMAKARTGQAAKESIATQTKLLNASPVTQSLPPNGENQV